MISSGKRAAVSGHFLAPAWCPAGRGLHIETAGGGRGRIVGSHLGRDWIAYDDDGPEHFREMCRAFDRELTA